jgi:hypothetical protein
MRSYTMKPTDDSPVTTEGAISFILIVVFVIAVILQCNMRPVNQKPLVPPKVSFAESKALQQSSNEQILFIHEDEALVAMYKALDHITDPFVRALKKKELLKAYDDAKEYQ